MSIGTLDNILELLKLIEEQKLNYVLALWSPPKNEDTADEVTIYTSFEKNAIKKVSEVLKEGIVITDSPKKNENKH